MLYGFLKGILPTMFRIIYRAEVHGQENVPKEGGAIIAANHISLSVHFVRAVCHLWQKKNCLRILFSHLSLQAWGHSLSIAVRQTATLSRLHLLFLAKANVLVCSLKEPEAKVVNWVSLRQESV